MLTQIHPLTSTRPSGLYTLAMLFYSLARPLRSSTILHTLRTCANTQRTCTKSVIARQFSSSLSPETPWQALASSSRLRHVPRPLLLFYQISGVAGIGIGLSFYFNSSYLYCEPVPANKSSSHQPPVTETSAPFPAHDDALPSPPKSSVNLYELTFGTLCGICAGVFVKKGVKTLAFVLGGVFVLLQYFGSFSAIRVDWSRLGQIFQSRFYTKDPSGVSRPPTIGSSFRWMLDFLTADFQPRASFIAGFALGIRVG